MRVEGPLGGFGELPKEKVDHKKKPAPSGSGVPPPSFVEELQAAAQEELPEKVDFQVLIADVEQAGRELLGQQSEEHLTKYKGAVKKFLGAAVKQSYQIKVTEGHGPNPKIYVSVEKIESKLDELLRSVLSAQKDPLRLLAQIEELHGLLLDLRL